MTKWEYIEDWWQDDSIQQRLNIIGSEGWELVSMFRDDHQLVQGAVYRVVFKRPVGPSLEQAFDAYLERALRR